MVGTPMKTVTGGREVAAAASPPAAPATRRAQSEVGENWGGRGLFRFRHEGRVAGREKTQT